jgi:hypothetical protein
MGEAWKPQIEEHWKEKYFHFFHIFKILIEEELLTISPPRINNPASGHNLQAE